MSIMPLFFNPPWRVVLKHPCDSFSDFHRFDSFNDLHHSDSFDHLYPSDSFGDLDDPSPPEGIGPQSVDVSGDQQVNAFAGLEAVTEQRPPCCPYCHNDDFIKYGFKGIIQRYLCKRCGKTFNARTGTPYARIRRLLERLRFDRAMDAKHSLREDARTLGVSVSTTFRWRHQNMVRMWEEEATLTKNQPLKGNVTVVWEEFSEGRSMASSQPNLCWAIDRLRAGVDIDCWKKGAPTTVIFVVSDEVGRHIETVSDRMTVSPEETAPDTVAAMESTVVPDVRAVCNEMVPDMMALPEMTDAVPVKGQNSIFTGIFVVEAPATQSVLSETLVPHLEVGAEVRSQLGFAEVVSDSWLGSKSPRFKWRLFDKRRDGHRNYADRLSFVFFQWLTSFNGIAVKYLKRYVGWFMHYIRSHQLEISWSGVHYV